MKLKSAPGKRDFIQKHYGRGKGHCMGRTLTMGSASLSRIRQKEYWRDLGFFLKGFWLLFCSVLFCCCLQRGEHKVRRSGSGERGVRGGVWGGASDAAS